MHDERMVYYGPPRRTGPDPVRILAWVALGLLVLVVVCCCGWPWILAAIGGIGDAIDGQSP